MRRLNRFLDWLLGRRCSACGQRVFPTDHAWHVLIEHPGDPYVE